MCHDRFINGFLRHVNPSMIILYIEVKESFSFYVHIYILSDVVF